MSFLIGFIAGLAVGYAGAYLQHNAEKRAELIALFKKKTPPQ